MSNRELFSSDTWEMLRIFPFFFAWNDSRIIVATGPSLSKLSPNARVGASVDDVFEALAQTSKSPFIFENRSTHRFIVVRDCSNNRLLRGSILYLGDKEIGIMLAAPWITTNEQLKEYQLKLGDFGPQDQTLEMLQLLQSQQIVTSDLKRLTEALLNERAKYRSEAERTQSLLRNASDGLHVLDKKGRVICASDSFAKRLGYGSNEVVGMHISQWDARFDRDTLEKWLWRLFEHQEVVTFETKHRGKDGSLLDVEVTARAVSLDGEPTLFASSRDVTERKKQARQLESLNARLEATISAAIDGVVVMDTSGKITEFNPAAEQLFGYRRDEVVGKLVSETIVPYKYREAHARGLDHYLRTGEGPVLRRRIEIEALRRDGSEFPIEIEMTAAQYSEGEFFVAFVRDITERQRAAESLHLYREKLEELVALRTEELEKKTTILDAVVTTSPSGLILTDEEGRICLTNPALEEMFGYTGTSLIGLHVEELVPDASREEHRRYRKEFTQAPKNRKMGEQLNLYGQRKDGTVFPADVSLTSFLLEGKRYIQASVIDISERKKHEEQLQDLNTNLERKVAERTTELIEASAAKSNFLAHMSHEIRTPMNGILGLAQLLERASLPPEQADMVSRIRKAGKSLLAIINDVLDFSKIEAGELRIELEPFEPAKILSQVDSLLGPSAREKGIELIVESSNDIDDFLTGDALRLEQVLINLISNAVKFSEASDVHVRVKTLELTPASVKLLFEVKDEGIGISKAHMECIFTPFSQADSSITRRFGGTGLGLAICKQLVELMGGRIGVESTLGVGSTFWFEIPFMRAGIQKDSTQKRSTPGIDKGPRLSGLNCLVVDDSRINRDVVERMLILEGAKVTTAADGQQAVEILRADGAAVGAVLMDVQMPVMDGLTATRMICRELRLLELPIIALTAGVLSEEQRNAKEAGVNDFLAKPVDFEELVAVLTPYTTRDPVIA